MKTQKVISENDNPETLKMKYILILLLLLLLKNLNKNNKWSFKMIKQFLFKNKNISKYLKQDDLNLIYTRVVRQGLSLTTWWR